MPLNYAKKNDVFICLNFETTNLVDIYWISQGPIYVLGYLSHLFFI